MSLRESNCFIAPFPVTPGEWADQLKFTVGEVVRVKGWAFRVKKATRDGRLTLEALPRSEVEELYRDLLVKLRRKQLTEKGN